MNHCYKTQFNPCFVTWCPDLKKSHILAVGTYSLSQIATQRIGNIEILECDFETKQLTLSKTIQTRAGVFRLFWIVKDEANYLVAALTNGNLFMWNMECDESFYLKVRSIPYGFIRILII